MRETESEVRGGGKDREGDREGERKGPNGRGRREERERREGEG